MHLYVDSVRLSIVKRTPPRSPADIAADALRSGSFDTVADEWRASAAITFRVAPARRDSYRDAAERAGESLTGWIVGALDAAAAQRFVQQAFPASHRKPEPK